MLYEDLSVGDWLLYEEAYYIKASTSAYCFLNPKEIENIKVGCAYDICDDANVEYVSSFNFGGKVINSYEASKNYLDRFTHKLKSGDIIQLLDDTNLFLVLVLDENQGMVLKSKDIVFKEAMVNVDGCFVDLNINLILISSIHSYENCYCDEKDLIEV